jgi:hypothetical protein
LNQPERMNYSFGVIILKSNWEWYRSSLKIAEWNAKITLRKGRTRKVRQQITLKTTLLYLLNSAVKKLNYLVIVSLVK